MRQALAVGIALVFSALSALHWYWVFGGVTGGVPAVLQVNGRAAFRPGRVATGRSHWHSPWRR